jgi:hypothetical protein
MYTKSALTETEICERLQNFEFSLIILKAMILHCDPESVKPSARRNLWKLQHSEFVLAERSLLESLEMSGRYETKIRSIRALMDELTNEGEPNLSCGSTPFRLHNN